MTEGEIQKQIKKAFKIELVLGDDEVGTQLKAVSFPLNCEWMRKVDALKIVEEARKKFPVQFVKLKGETLIMGAREMYEWSLEYLGSGKEDESKRKD